MPLCRVEFPELVYPCWAYAFARNGKKFTLEWLKHEFDKVAQPYASGAEEGDVFVWNADERIKDFYPVGITQGGVVVSRFVDYNCHVAVYEGHGKVSDMTSFYSNCLPFIIRVRSLEDIKCSPDRMIKQGDLP